MADLSRVQFVEWDVLTPFGNPHEPATRLRAQQALGFVPWPFTMRDGRSRAGLVPHCPRCGVTGSLNFTDWQWNGDTERPTLAPSVYFPKGQYFCGFHCHVTEGRIIDAGTPAHGGTA